MKQTWFKKAGWIYLPIHPVGIFITLGRYHFYGAGMYGSIQKCSLCQRWPVRNIYLWHLHCFLVEVGCRKNFLNT